MKTHTTTTHTSPGTSALRGRGLMKKQLLLLGLVAATSLSSFGQGWFVFAATKNKGFDLSSGAVVAGGAQDSFAFLWSVNTAAIPAVGNAGTSPDVPWLVFGTWSQILWDPNYTFAVNATTAGNPVAVAVGNGSAGWNYNGGLSFPVLGTPTSGTVNCYVIGWNNRGGTLTTPAQAAVAEALLGYSSVFSYPVGALSSSAVLSFSAAGLNAFGISGIPEPATFAILSLGAAVLLASRRPAGKKLPTQSPK